MDIINNLNPEQKKAVININGPVLIVAGAGAGKTRVITHRIAYLISKNIAPQNILAVTFTNKAANEMRERMVKLLTPQSSTSDIRHPTSEIQSLYIGTFHSLGVRILRANGKHIDIPKNFSILDEGDALKLIKESLVELNLDPKQWQPKKMKNLISKQKNLLNDLDKFANEAEGEYFLGTLANIWRLYEDKLISHKALDFDDLIIKTVQLFKASPEVLEYYQAHSLKSNFDLS